MPKSQHYQNQSLKDARSDDVFKKPKDMTLHQTIDGERKERIKLWVTLFRRNPARFIDTYFGIHLHPYQILMIWVLQRSNLAYIVASRASAKTWLIAVWALTLGVLYPGIKIIVCAKTLKQGGILISEKIKGLIETHPNVAREVRSYTANANTYEVIMHCGSTIRVVPSSDSSRGKNSVLFILLNPLLEEHIKMIRSDMWTDKEILYAVENRINKSYAEIGKDIGRTRNAVMVKLNRLGYKLDNYEFDKMYFDVIDTQDKAYWLGFIYADGNVYIFKKNNVEINYVMGIEISIKDIDHLKKFNESISGNLDIKTRDRKIEGYSNVYGMASIRVYSKEFVKNLQKQGVMENKSLKICFPSLEKELIPHFIRGFYDGDGSISIDKRSQQLRCNFTSGSKEFLNDLKNIFLGQGIRCYVGSTYKNSNSYTLGITGRDSTINFTNFIYQDASLFLERKHNFYLSNIHLLEYIRKGWNKTNASICGNA